MELGCQDPPGNQEWAPSVHRGARERRARQETPVHPVRPGQQVSLAYREILDSKAILDHQERPGYRVRLGRVEHRGRQEHQEELVPLVW